MPPEPTKGQEAKPFPASLEEQHRLLLDCVTDYAIFFLDPTGLVSSWNAGAERVLGYSEEEVLGRHFSLFFPAEDRARGAPEHELQTAAQRGRAADDRWLVRKDGLRIWVSGVTTPLRDERELRGFAKVARDRTEQKLAEEAARASENRFRALVENAWDGVTLLAADGTMLATTPITFRGLGYAPEEYVGRNGLELLHPEDAPRVSGLLATLLTQPGSKLTAQYRLRHKDGSWRWVEATASNLLHEPSVQAVVVNHRDITEQRRVEEQYRLLFNRNPLPTWVFDLDTLAFLDVNEAAVREYGYSREEFLALTLEDLRPEEDVARLRAHLEVLPQAEGGGVWRHRKKDGTVIEVELTGQDIPFAGKRARLILINDVTARRAAEAERKRLAEELRLRAEQLADADRRKDEFLATLAHELRNPLAPIRNAAELLGLAGLAEPRLRSAQEAIERQAKHLTRLVDDLLDVSRVTRGKIKLHREVVPVPEVVARAVEIARPLIDARRHHLAVSLPAGPLYLEGDLVRLAQVLANLLSNAAKYTDEGGHIALSAGQEGGEVVFRVRDRGVGIPAEMLGEVFDLFTQVDHSQSRSHGGLGIGLALVKRLTEMHGGSVSAHSEGPGKGSEFVVRLPPASPPEGGPQQRKEGVKQDGPVGSGFPLGPVRKRVLVIDDNVDAAESLAVLLNVYGHDARTAHDGQAGLEAVRGFPADVVLLDIGLPRMDGYEVARRLRQAHPRLVLVALTGYGQEEDRRRSREAGFDHHLTKPADPDELRRLLAGLPVSP